MVCLLENIVVVTNVSSNPSVIISPVNIPQQYAIVVEKLQEIDGAGKEVYSTSTNEMIFNLSVCNFNFYVLMYWCNEVHHKWLH